MRSKECTGAALAEKLADAVRVAREEAVQDIFLMVPWEHTRCIDNILDGLSVLPVPVYSSSRQTPRKLLKSAGISSGRDVDS